MAEDVENEEYVGDMYVAADVPLVETAPSSLLPCKCHGSGGLGRILRCIACAGDRFECAYCRKWKCLDIGCGVCGQDNVPSRDLTAETDAIAAGVTEREIAAQEALLELHTETGFPRMFEGGSSSVSYTHLTLPTK